MNNSEQERINGLVEICSRIGFKTEDAEAYLLQKGLSGEEITKAAISLVDDFRYEVDTFKNKMDREPMAEELVSNGFIELFGMLLRYGLDPQLVYCDKNGCQNLLYSLFMIDNRAVMLRLYRLLFENGADPNVMIDGETFFEIVDSDVVILAREFGIEHREAYEAAFRVWLTCIAYGAFLPNGTVSLKMKNGYGTDIFKESERFSYRIEYVRNDWYMHIFYTESGEEVAVL